ncbi:MAG: TraC family protein [Candidatus Omnitrophica bacterium]|nr:TraC family protein [Candidatus Omnitrophota bacterium]
MKTSLLLKTRDLIQREKRPAFLKEIDLYKIEDGILLGVSGAMGQGFKFGGRDLLLGSEAEIDDFERKMRKFLNALPEGATLHFVVRSESGDEESLEEYAASIQTENPLNQTFLEAKLEAYRTHPFTKRKIFLFVVIHPASKRPRSSFLPDLSVAFGKKAHHLSELEYGTSKEALSAVAGEIEESFRNLGFEIRPLTDRDMLHYLYEFLNPDYSETILSFEDCNFQEYEFDPSSLRSRLALHPPRLDYEHFYLNHYFYRALNLLRLPESTNLKSMKDFEQALGKNYFLTVTFEVPDQDKEKAEIKRYGNFAKAKSFYSRAKDHDALVQAGETDALLTEIAQSSDKLFYVSLSVMVRGRSAEESARLSRQALRAYRGLPGARGRTGD